MKILTFDIEEWYEYRKYPKGGEGFYLPLINDCLDRLLDLLAQKEVTATFFCLGIIAREYPEVIQRIQNKGHEIACHSDIHRFLHTIDESTFKEDTRIAIDSLEQITGTKVKGYRAPAFSITEHTKWAIEILSDSGVEYDCSIFPTSRRFGGYTSFPTQNPTLVKTNGKIIKEFPMTMKRILGKEIPYSGGGYFRIFPHSLINKFMNESDYSMTYLHIRDFDAKQKKIPKLMYFIDYYGIDTAFEKLGRLIENQKFISVQDANRMIDWSKIKTIEL